MWLPTPIYERIPQFWLLLGLLFMSSGTYLGFDYSLSFVYFGVGLVCCIWSLWIFSMRLTHRSEAKDQAKVERAAAARQSQSEASEPEPSQAEAVVPGAEPVA